MAAEFECRAARASLSAGARGCTTTTAWSSSNVGSRTRAREEVKNERLAYGPHVTFKKLGCQTAAVI
jgi:hypothetical protein